MSYSIDEKKVIYADLDPTEGIVLHLDTKNYYKLNETGQTIWQAISAKKEPEEIVRSLVSIYEISEENAREDVSTLIEQLQREQLVQMETKTPFDVAAARQSKKDAR